MEMSYSTHRVDMYRRKTDKYKDSVTKKKDT